MNNHIEDKMCSVINQTTKNKTESQVLQDLQELKSSIQLSNPECKLKKNDE